MSNKKHRKRCRCKRERSAYYFMKGLKKLIPVILTLTMSLYHHDSNVNAKTTGESRTSLGRSYTENLGHVILS